MPENDIIETVRQTLGAKRLPVMKLAKETGIPVFRIYKWLDGTANPKDDDAERLQKWVDQIAQGMTPSDLSRANEIQKIRLSLNDGARFEMVDGPPSGTFEKWQDVDTVVLDYLRAPFIGETEGVIEITGDDMSPTFRPGTRVAVQRLQDPKIFTPGQFYLIIDRNGQSFVRRMLEGSGHEVVLKADNDRDFPQFRRSWKDIRAVFKIKADINKL